MAMFVLYALRARHSGPFVLVYDEDAPAVEAVSGDQAVKMFKDMGHLAPIVGLHPIDEERRRREAWANEEQVQ